MSENAKLFVGDIVPLNLQVWDGKVDLFVRAYPVLADGTALGSVDLEHVGQGKYIDTDDSLAMPNTPHLHVTYVVFSDALYSLESENHGRGTDIFEKNELRPEQLPDANLTGNVQGQVNVSGGVTDENIEGKVESSKVTGKVFDPEIEGDAGTESIEGSTEQENIQGKIDC